jgi:signal transduction histidine kinase/CheY-like chemotaxis protein
MISDGPTPDDAEDETAILIRRLHETEQRLRELTGGEVDAVMHPAGDSYLLKQAQERLLDSESAQRRLAVRQSDILNAVPALIVLLDRDGTIVAVNNTWRDCAKDKVLGEADAYIGANYLEICDKATGPEAEDARAAAAGIRSVLEGRERSFSLEYPCHSATERRWFRLHVNTLKDGHADGAVIAHIDITERKQAEENLRIRALQQTAVAELGRMALTNISPSKFMQTIVDAVAKTFEVEYSSILESVLDEGRSTVRIVAASTMLPGAEMNIPLAEPRNSVCWHALLSEGPVIIDNLTADDRFNGDPILRRAGFASCISVAIPGDNGPWGALGAFTVRQRKFTADDIGFIQSVANLIAVSNRRRKAEQELLDSKALLQIAGELGRLGGWVADIRTNRVNWSDEVCAIHEVPPETSVSIEEAGDFYAPESRPKLEKAFRVCAAYGKPFDQRLELVTANGRLVSVRTIGRAMRDDTGAIVGVQGAIQDITEQLALETQLKQAQRLEAIGHLTGGVAHDFNNLLTAITSTIDILAAGVAEKPKLAAIVKLIGAAADRGAELTGQLLAFARRQPLQPRKIDVNAVIVDTVKLLRPVVGQNIEIATILADDVFPALVDPTQLGTTLLNLAINARDAMPNGGKLTLAVSGVALDSTHAKANGIPEGDYARITVSDTGSGIPAAVLDRIFEPFFTTKGFGKGSGLGLSMVYGFVKQSGGQIKVHTEEGQGTTFEIYLPRAGADTARSLEAPGDPQIKGGNETILIVEDDALVRTSVNTQIQGLGYQTLLAANAAEALAIADRPAQFDLLFTDVMMPGTMNGQQLAEEMAKRRSPLKVLFTSGYAENVIAHGGRLDDGILFLSKPYRKSDLARMLRRALDGPEASPADAPEPKRFMAS